MTEKDVKLKTSEETSAQSKASMICFTMNSEAVVSYSPHHRSNYFCFHVSVHIHCKDG